MTILYLTRHGQTLWNIERRLQGWGDSPLTKIGIKQAENLRDRFKNINLDVIYSSPLKRAFNTANIIKGERKLEILVNDDLKEVNFGLLEGLAEKEINEKNSYKEQVFNLFNNPREYVPLDGETISDAKERCHKAIKEILKENKDKSILIVTHGMLLNLIMMMFQDNENEEESNIIMGQASLTKIEINNDGICNILLKNDESHHKNF